MIDALSIPFSTPNPAGLDLMRLDRGEAIARSAERAAPGRTASEFRASLANQRHARAETKSREQEAEEAARQLVATTFIQPLLEQLNEPTFISEGPFTPGDAERRFSPLLHQHLADRIAEAGDFPIVDAVKRTLLAKSHGGSQRATGVLTHGKAIDVTR